MNKNPMTPEEKRAETARKKRLYRQTEAGKASVLKWAQSEKGKASLKKHNQTEKAKARRREASRRWRATEKGKELTRLWNASDAAKEAKSAWNKTDRAKAIKIAYAKRIRAEQRKARKASPEIGEAFTAQLMGNELYAAVSSKVSRSFRPDVRDDIIMEIILAVLEGIETVESATKNARRFAPDAYKEDGFKNISASTPIYGSDGLTIMDTLTNDRSE